MPWYLGIESDLCAGGGGGGRVVLKVAGGKMAVAAILQTRAVGTTWSCTKRTVEDA